MSQLLTAVLTHPLLLSAAGYNTNDYGYSSDEGGAWFWLIGPAGGIGFYMWVFFRYRNTNKRHAYEHDSVTEQCELRTHDLVVDRIVGTTERSIRGQNSHRPLQRLGSATTIAVLPAPQTPVVEHLEAQATAAQEAQAAQAAAGQDSPQPSDATAAPETGAAGGEPDQNPTATST